MSELCDRVLAADKRIRFAMTVDEQGTILCEKGRAGKYAMPKETILELGGVWASVVGGVLRRLSDFHGRFEYIIVKNEKVTLIGMENEKGYVIFTTKEENVQQLIERVRTNLT